jgi:hypothetical protein
LGRIPASQILGKDFRQVGFDQNVPVPPRVLPLEAVRALQLAAVVSVYHRRLPAIGLVFVSIAFWQVISWIMLWPSRISSFLSLKLA